MNTSNGQSSTAKKVRGPDKRKRKSRDEEDSQATKNKRREAQAQTQDVKDQETMRGIEVQRITDPEAAEKAMKLFNERVEARLKRREKMQRQRAKAKEAKTKESGDSDSNS